MDIIQGLTLIKGVSTKYVTVYKEQLQNNIKKFLYLLWSQQIHSFAIINSEEEITSLQYFLVLREYSLEPSWQNR